MRPSASKSEKPLPKTEKFLLGLTSELKQKVKQEAHKMFGNRKGAESIYVEMVLRIYLKMNVEGVQET
jgi:hypothetical protein